MRTAHKNEIEFINKHRAISELKPDDVYVQTFLLANTEFIPKYSMFIHSKAVKQMAEKAGKTDDDGVNFKVMHDRYKVVALGKSFAGAFDGAGNAAYAKFYFPKGHSENGYTTDDLVRGIDTGVYTDTSFGMGWPIKENSMKCSLCGGNPLWFRKYLGGKGEFCGHWPGDQYKTTEAMVDFINKTKSEGMDSYPGQTIKVGAEVEARMWQIDTEGNLDELSVVDRGASDSRPAREDEIPVKFSVAKEHPAFRLAASKENDGGVRELLGNDLRMTIDSKLVMKETDETINEDLTKVNKDTELLGEQGGEKTKSKGGEVKLEIKELSSKMKQWAINVLSGGDVETADKDIAALLTEAQETMQRLEASEKGLKAEVVTLTSDKTAIQAKFDAIPEDIRAKVADASLTWKTVLDFVNTCRKELDTVCSDLGAAAVAALGNEAKVEDLKAQVLAKAEAFDLETAVKYARTMIKTYQDGQAVKTGLKADPGATGSEGDDPKVKDEALTAFAKEAVDKINKS